MIFHDDADRQRYLSLLQEVKTRYGWKLYAYVLMGNHVHLLVEVAGVPLSKEKELQKRVGKLQLVIREGRKPRMAIRQA